MEKFDYPELGSKIRHIRGKLSQEKFAKLLDVSQASVSKYENGMKPEVDVLHKIAKHANTTIEALLEEGGFEEGAGAVLERQSSMTDINPTITEIDEYNLKITAYEVTGAGPEREETGYEPVGSIIIPKKLYKPNLIVFKVDGDSMEKWIMNKTYVLVDPTPQNKLHDKGIYCFKIPYSGYIIRLVHTEPDALFLEPVNKQYKTRKIAWGSFNPEWVLGRVVGNLINTYV